MSDLHPAFDREKFLLRQKCLSLNEKYHVCDEQGQSIMFVERPRRLGRTVLAYAAAGGVFILALIVTLLAADGAGTLLGDMAALSAAVVVGAAGLMAVVWAAWRIYPLRHVGFFTDDTKSQPLLAVIQPREFNLLVASYSVCTPSGETLAVLRKKYIYNIVRKRWYVLAPDGSDLFLAMEDSLFKSLLRRFLGSLFGVLRTNFIFTRDRGVTTCGKFDRNFTILDRYSLDLTADPGRTIDRRVAVALGVMLDTGEKR